MDGLRAPLLERSVVQERVRLRGEDAARERGRFHRVDRPPLDRAVFQAAQHFHETVHVHRLGQTVLDRLGDDGMVHRDRDGAARQGLRAREHLREGGGEEIVRAHPQEVRRDLLAVAGPLEKERALRVPAPPGLEHRRREKRLDEDLACAPRMEVVEDVVQREAVLRAKREDDRLFVGRGLQLEAETDAELLAQRETPGAVDFRSERGVHDELHPAALVEEALEDHPLLRRHFAQGLASRGDVIRDLHRRAVGQRISARRSQESRAVGLLRRALLAQRPDLRRELARASRTLAQPERQARGLPLRVRDPDDPGLHAEDAP